MSDTLEPRQVSVRDIPGWGWESWNLLWRRPLLFLCASAVYHVLAFSARAIPHVPLLFAILLCYIFLVMMIGFSEAADHSRQIRLLPTYIMLRKVILLLILLTGIYASIYVVSAIVGTLLPLSVPAVDYTSRALFPLVKWTWPGEAAFIILFMGILITSMWFLSPLLALHELGIRDARALAKRAEDKNVVVILVGCNLPFLLIVALVLITEASLLLSPLFIPLFAIYQYVSYRHVFLGRKKSNPVPVKASVEATVKATAN